MLKLLHGVHIVYAWQ